MTFKTIFLGLSLVFIIQSAQANNTSLLKGKWSYVKTQSVFPASMKIPTTDAKVFHKWLLEFKSDNKCREVSQLTPKAKVEIAEGTCTIQDNFISRSYNKVSKIKIDTLTQTDLILSTQTNQIKTKMFFKREPSSH